MKMHLHDSTHAYLHLFYQSQLGVGTGQAACSCEGLGHGSMAPVFHSNRSGTLYLGQCAMSESEW